MIIPSCACPEPFRGGVVLSETNVKRKSGVCLKWCNIRGLCKTVLLSKFCIFVISKSSRITYTLRF